MKTGPKLKDFCKYGHVLNDTSTYQTYKNGNKNGRRCKVCQSFLKKIYRNNPKYRDKILMDKRDWQNKKFYGIDTAERDSLLQSQGNACAICKRTGLTWGKGFNDTWHIDHKHDGTMNHRGILCAKCNILLGQLGDDTEYIQGILDYLKKWQ